MQRLVDSVRRPYPKVSLCSPRRLEMGSADLLGGLVFWLPSALLRIHKALGLSGFGRKRTIRTTEKLIKLWARHSGCQKEKRVLSNGCLRGRSANSKQWAMTQDLRSVAILHYHFCCYAKPHSGLRLSFLAIGRLMQMRFSASQTVSACLIRS